MSAQEEGAGGWWVGKRTFDDTAGSLASAVFYVLFRVECEEVVDCGSREVVTKSTLPQKAAAARLVIWWALGMRSGQRNKAIDNASNSGYVYTRR